MSDAKPDAKGGDHGKKGFTMTPGTLFAFMVAVGIGLMILGIGLDSFFSHSSFGGWFYNISRNIAMGVDSMTRPILLVLIVVGIIVMLLTAKKKDDDHH